MVTGRTKDGSVFPLTVRFIASTTVAAEPTAAKKMCTTINQDGIPPMQNVSETLTGTDGHLKEKEDEEEKVEEEGMGTGEGEGRTAQQQPTQKEGDTAEYFLSGKVIVYSAVSGMLSFLSDGTIHGCNHHFALMMFGYSQQELVKKVRNIYCFTAWCVCVLL